jgi:hypothetical protein
VDLLVEVAAHGEKYGFEVPCLLVAAKDDLEPDPICHQSSIQVWIALFSVLLCLFSSSLQKGSQSLAILPLAFLLQNL